MEIVSAGRSLTSLAFLVFQLTTATLYLRPAELFEPLAEMPIYEGLILTSLVLSLQEVQGHFRGRLLKWQPVTLSVVGVLIAIMFSHFQHAYFGAVIDSGEEFVKTLIYYSVLIATVTTPPRLYAFAANVAICGSTMVGLCALDFAEVIDLQFIEHLIDLDDYDEEGVPIFVHRMRGTGIFQDPNDIAMVITASTVLSLFFLFDKSLRVFRFLWAAPIGMMMWGLFLTQSRGGLVGLMAALFFIAVASFGRNVAIVMATVGLCCLPLVGSRLTRLGLEEGGTGHERITMWQEGFDALKSPDFLFGIGHDTYADLAGLVAHNSFVHAYVELGVIGGTTFFACFFFIVLQLWRLSWRLPELCNERLLRFYPYVCGLVGGWIFAMMSLSRCYVVPTYMTVGLAAAYLNLCGLHSNPARPLVEWNGKIFQKLIFSSATMFIGLYVFTYIMSR